MGKVGSIFRDARLGKGLTLDQVADETNISKRFLQGIENDSYDGFPGEVYILGFIRNYADFLGLDARKMVDAYHAVETPQKVSDDVETMRVQPAPRSIDSAMSSQEPAKEPAPAHIEQAQTPEPAQAPISAEHPHIPSLFSEEDESPPTAELPQQGKKQVHRKSRNKDRESETSLLSMSSDQSTAGSQPQSSYTQRDVKKKAQEIETETEKGTSPTVEKPSLTKKEKMPHIQLGRIIPLALVGIVVVIAVISIVPTLRLHSKASHVPAEYRAEGLPFEQRLYPQDKVFLPLGNDFVSMTLTSIKDKVTFDTPYGPLNAGLNEEAVINPSSESERLIAVILDFAPNEPQNGVRVRFDTKPALSSADQPGDITVAADTQKNQGVQTSPALAPSTQSAPEVLFRSSGGPHPFYVSVSFMAPVLFRYEADKKEWVEKYYRKGESITVNASNSITFWAANAQAVKVNVFQSAGKSTELVMGGAGEIAVKRLSWSNAQGGWAVVANTLD